MLSFHYYYFTPSELFIPDSIGWFSLKFKGWQVFSDLQDFSEYSSWSYQDYHLDGLDSSSDLQFSQSPQISRTFPSILADLISTFIWIVLILPLISNSPNLFFLAFLSVSCAPYTIDITVIFIFHGFFLSSDNIKIFDYFFISFSFHSVFS